MRRTATCADGLIARSSGVNDGRQAKWLTTAYWTFIAPPGTEIVGFTSWRFAEARDQGGDDPNTFADEGDHWTADVVDDSNAPIGGLGGPESCVHGDNVPACNIGAPGGTAQSHRLIATQLRWQIGCGGDIVGGCPTNFGGYPLATMVVYGAKVTLQDDSAPSATLGGPLLGAGLAQAERPAHLQRFGQFGHPNGKRVGWSAHSDGRAQMRLHVQGALQQRGRSFARVHRRPAGRSVPGDPDRHRRREKPAKRRQQGRCRRYAPVGRPASATRSRLDPQGRR